MTTNGEIWSQQHPELARLSGASKHAKLSQPTARKAKAGLILPESTFDGTVLRMTLPLPHRVLHKNGRTKSIAWRASLVKAAKNMAGWIAFLAVRPSPPWTAARIDATFWTANKLDDDGAWFWLVPYRDGIAEALQCNDLNFTCGTIRQFTGKASGGRREVEIQITRLTADRGVKPWTKS